MKLSRDIRFVGRDVTFLVGRIHTWDEATSTTYPGQARYSCTLVDGEW